MMFLQSVVAVKYKTGVKERNLFFLRNAKIKKNELSFDLYLSCVNNVQDLYKLDITNLFELKPHLNYFFTTNVKMSNFLEVLSDEFIQRICTYADRKQANFKMRSTY